ncbi:DUF4873 domain-containing protein [Mycolicibacterium palauense]|uniref:DUF4873 domain-containing protein n=1 Tax=Mycolicibacterium palauense TaxID=2034511 RepID=UPI000BFF180E|nr:DUF4873 domain-containing protein [Mycolicibacterium palauense]
MSIILVGPHTGDIGAALGLGSDPAVDREIDEVHEIHGMDAARFDAATDTWSVTAPGAGPMRARIVVDARPSENPVLACHGLPNFFRLPGPDHARQARYVRRCLDLCRRTGSARIEAKGQVRMRRWRRQPMTRSFYLTPAAPDDELYDGPVTATVAEREIAARVRLTGHLDPVDGRYHWQGTLFAELPGERRTAARAVDLRIADRTAHARVVERTPWGAHMVAGVGDPPFAP